jgi:hypothetical protein
MSRKGHPRDATRITGTGRPERVTRHAFRR